MTEAQRVDLERIYGEVEIKKIDRTISSWREVAEAGADCEVLAVVLPPAILADLVSSHNNEKPVIKAIASRVETGKTVINPATGKEEKEYAFEHAGWERVVRIEVVTERL